MTDKAATTVTESMVTTVDNPWDPFTQFREWYQYDVSSGYNTSALLARLVVTSNELSVAYRRAIINDAVDEIVRENVLGIYRKVTRQVPITDQEVA